MLRAFGFLLAGLLLGGIAVLGYQWVKSDPDVVPSRPAEGELPPKQVIVQGTLEPRVGPVLVASPLIGFEIKHVQVKAGDAVEANQPLIELDAKSAQEELAIAQGQSDDAQERQAAEIEVAELRLEAAQLAVKQAEDSRELELASQRKRMELAELKVKQASSDLERFTSLSGGPDPLISAQQLQQQELLWSLSLAEKEGGEVALRRLEQTLDFQLKQAQAELKSATSTLALARKGISVAALKSQIELAKMKMAQTKILSPTSGTVLNLFAHAGEIVSTQPLVQLADLSQLVCIAEVDVSDLPRLQEGDTATIKLRSLPAKQFKGTIERVGSAASPPTLRPVDPRQSVDRTVTKVVLAIDAADARQLLGVDKKGAAALVGLQVEVSFEPSASRHASVE